ncbi:MAG: SH3 domain-containing protein [Clostridia bacterium]|nr:SH3 domain-containing protein [Clostridia bacterium]
MKNPKGLIVTIILVVAPVLWLVFRLNTIENNTNISGDYAKETADFKMEVEQLDEASTSVISGDNRSGEYMSSRYGNPISKLIEGAKINDSSVIIYEEPSEDSNPIGSVNKDVLITAQDYDNGWTQIKFDTTSGWVKSEFIIKPDDGTSNAIKSAVGKEGTVIVDTLNVRAAASTVGDPIDQISFGDKFKVLDDNADGSWYNIQYGAKNGWIKGDSKYVQIDYNS